MCFLADRHNHSGRLPWPRAMVCDWRSPFAYAKGRGPQVRGSPGGGDVDRGKPCARRSGEAAIIERAVDGDNPPSAEERRPDDVIHGAGSETVAEASDQWRARAVWPGCAA